MVFGMDLGGLIDGLEGLEGGVGMRVECIKFRLFWSVSSCYFFLLRNRCTTSTGPAAHFSKLKCKTPPCHIQCVISVFLHIQSFISPEHSKR